MATAWVKRGGRVVGGLLGLLAVLNASLSAEEASLPAVRDHHLAVPADQIGIAPIVGPQQLIQPLPIGGGRNTFSADSGESVTVDRMMGLRGDSSSRQAGPFPFEVERGLVETGSSISPVIFGDARVWQDNHPAFAQPAHHGPIHGNSTPASGDLQEMTTDPRYERVIDLLDRNDRQLVERVREVVTQTEVGIDTTAERWITVRGGDRITWGGRIETDVVNWPNDDEFQGMPPLPDGQQNYVEFRRLRFFAAGEGYGVFDYQLELEFAENDALVKDAFVGMHELPWLGYAMIGHFRVPIGLENLTSTRFIPFMERSLPTRLLPGRALGVAFFNKTPSRNATWSFGAFLDDIDEGDKRRIDDNQGTRAIGRLTWTPYYDEASRGDQLMHTGVGYMYTRPRLETDVLNPMTGNRPVSFFARPEINQGDPLIDTGTILVDQYHTGNVELAYASGPLTVQSELTWTSLENADGNTDALYAAYVYASWFLTGERRPYNRDFGIFGRVVPYENFWSVHTDQGQRTGWGAWEIAFRWSYLSFADVNNQYLNDLTTGINWYWNPHTRVMLNWIHPVAHNSMVATNPADDAHGDIIALRMAIDF